MTQKIIKLVTRKTVLRASAGGQPTPATQAEAEAGTVTAARAWSPLRIKQAIAALSGAIRTLLGQYDTRTDLTATNGGTCTLNYNSGNAFTIDASDLNSGQGFTVAVSNWPAGDVYSALSLQMSVGSAADLSITWPTGVAAPELTASKRNRFVLSTWDNGTTTDLDAQEAL